MNIRILFVFFLIGVNTLHACAQEKISFANNKIIAHRGAWKNAQLPENSIAALQQAIKMGCTGAEFDVRMTKDEVLVVNHDAEFNNLIVEESTYKQLSKFKLSNGESIPTLKEFIKAGLKDNNTTGLVCEIKATKNKDRNIRMTDKVLELVSNLNAENHILAYISFNYDVLKRIKSKSPNANTQFLGGYKSPEQLQKDEIGGLDYKTQKYKESPEWISAAKTLGLSLNAWTANTRQDMEWLLGNDFDYITTDEPELLKELVNNVEYILDWKLIWNDEFSGAGIPDTTKWNFDIGGHGWGNNEKQYYTSADTLNAKIENGKLIITARAQKTDKNDYTSARLTTKNKGDWRYGKIDVRAKLPKGKGLWPAIWMLPTESAYGGWPRSGEIDIMEFVGYSPDTIFQTVHTKSFNHLLGTQVGKSTKVDSIGDKFHNYSIIWDSEKILFFIDGRNTHQFLNKNQTSAEWPFDQEFHLILNLAVGGNWGGKFGIDDSIFPSQFEIAYVRVYQK
ncbi:glycerophosphodiester phosphodiesterase family protein [Draconibacterium sediminis]|uniref:Licheninase n=1 Tax=Draconibacterium sediminis TaxID=1544798 RepID=A0A0D8JDV5_9BACT|nr:glycerophosphodiester phosphodiesterase family protein [Draconibacterium sediminis]KJF45102.1 licheninase [Draconibacterium sediminis]